MNRMTGIVVVGALLGGLMGSSAHAQFAVVDVGAIAQLVQQVQTMQQQLETARNQLSQAEQTLSAMRGGRGMEQLLSGTTRNYLPSSWADLVAIMEGRGVPTELAAEVQALVAANAILDSETLASLAPPDRSRLEADRRAAAAMQVTTRRALQTTSERFSNLQQLIDAIPRADDQKAILDLQARIAAEQLMLANEQTKLDMLIRTAQAEELARKQRMRESAISALGSLRHLPPVGL